jgi:hypothetical protein
MIRDRRLIWLVCSAVRVPSCGPQSCRFRRETYRSRVLCSADLQGLEDCAQKGLKYVGSALNQEPESEDARRFALSFLELKVKHVYGNQKALTALMRKI